MLKLNQKKIYGITMGHGNNVVEWFFAKSPSLDMLEELIDTEFPEGTQADVMLGRMNEGLKQIVRKRTYNHQEITYFDNE